MREYRKKNREKLNAQARKRYHDAQKDDPELKSQRAARSARWYEENAEEISKKRKAKYQKKAGCFSDEKRKEYYDRAKSKPDFKEMKRQSTKKISTLKRRKISDLQVALGCMNPECKWSGEYKSCDLDFHHLDPKEKKMLVSQMGTCSLDLICEEINKCIVVCSICHRRLHAGYWTPCTRCNVKHDGENLIIS